MVARPARLFGATDPALPPPDDLSTASETELHLTTPRVSEKTGTWPSITTARQDDIDATNAPLLDHPSSCASG
jgi:hypothetical protein